MNTRKQLEKKYIRVEEMKDVLNAWLFRREMGLNIADWLKKQGIKKVAIYGCADLGQHLIYELEQGGMEISYLIDRNGQTATKGYRLYNPSDSLPPVDMIIVTALQSYEGIKCSLENRGLGNIVSLKELI